ncbi:MAG: aminopeptidase P family protein [Chloroflexota bacterium]|nr:aminopeptidase P family protein [Chloroflexota bacterium]
MRQSLSEEGLEALLISQPENRRYISGFTGSAGYLIISSTINILAVDFRYTEQARVQAPDFTVIQTKGSITDWLPPMISDLGLAKLCFEGADISFTIYNQLVEQIKKHDKTFQFEHNDGLIENLRAQKEPEEIDRLMRASALSDEAFAYIASEIHEGQTEKQVAWEMERYLREKGCEHLPFPIIVASGPNSALPHASPSDRVIQSGEPIVIDFGARVEGYCSDCTRTICLNMTDSTFTKHYDLVLGAQLAAIATLAPGMSGEEADQLARIVIEEGQHGEAFGHGLGHGIGLVAHEKPRLSPKSHDMLKENMVFTVEPGIYHPGWGGIRIEDMVILQEGKAKTLTRAKK